MDTEASMERPLDTMYSEEDHVGFVTFEDQLSKAFNEENRGEREQMRNPEGASASERDKGFGERIQEDVEFEITDATFKAVARADGDKCLVSEEERDLTNLVTGIETLRENAEFGKGNMDFEVVASVDGETQGLNGAETKVDSAPKEANSPSEIASPEIPEPDIMKDCPTSLRIDSTPPSKLPNTAEGGSTPDFLLIPTPAPRERPKNMRKRKCLFDDQIVLPNDLIKRSLRDSSDLVCKRRKAPHNAFTAWKATRALGFLEPLIPYSSSDLRLLYSGKNLKISMRCENFEAPEKEKKVPQPPSGDGSLEQAEISSEGPEKVKVPEPPSGNGSLEQAEIAPETPVRQFPSRRPFESPMVAKSDEVRPESPSGSVALEKEPSVYEDQELMFTLMNEDLNTSEGETDNLYGWTGRTRTVAKHLNKVFRKQKGEGEAPSLFQISKGRTQKESARLFYEILVLKSRGYIDVEQQSAYADVLIRKLPKWEQAINSEGPKQCS